MREVCPIHHKWECLGELGTAWSEAPETQKSDPICLISKTRFYRNEEGKLVPMVQELGDY